MRPDEIEIAQGNHGQVRVAGARIGQDLLADQLRASIRIRWVRRVILDNRNSVLVTVDRARRGEDEPPHAVLQHRAPEAQCHLAYFDHAALPMFSLFRTGLGNLMVGGASWRVPCWPGFLTGEWLWGGGGGRRGGSCARGACSGACCR